MTNPTITQADREVVLAFCNEHPYLSGLDTMIHFAAMARENEERLKGATENEAKLSEQLREAKAALIAEQEHTEQLQAALAERERELLDLRSHSREQSSLLAEVDAALILSQDDSKGCSYEEHLACEAANQAAVKRQEKRRNGATESEAKLHEQKKRKGA